MKPAPPVIKRLRIFYLGRGLRDVSEIEGTWCVVRGPWVNGSMMDRARQTGILSTRANDEAIRVSQHSRNTHHAPRLRNTTTHYEIRTPSHQVDMRIIAQVQEDRSRP